MAVARGRKVVDFAFNKQFHHAFFVNIQAFVGKKRKHHNFKKERYIIIILNRFRMIKPQNLMAFQEIRAWNGFHLSFDGNEIAAAR